MQEGEGRHHILYGCDLGGIRFEEFQARRHVAEQVANLNGDAGEQRPGTVFDHLARPDVDPRAGAGALDVRHRGDARERLAAEP